MRTALAIQSKDETAYRAAVTLTPKPATKIPRKTPTPEMQKQATETPTVMITTTVTDQVFDEETQSEEVYNDQLNLTGYLCIPAGVGLFPAIIYNHGGLGTTIGGAPEETCQALAEAGMVGFSPIRRETIPLSGHFEDVEAAIDYVKKLTYVDAAQIGMIGFSRGGLLTYITASQRNDLRFVIIMASAEPKDREYSDYASQINAPVLIMVAENDLPAELNQQQNLVVAANEMEEGLRNAGKDVQLVVYPPFNPHGHVMFFEIGEYWEDVIHFTNSNLLD